MKFFINRLATVIAFFFVANSLYGQSPIDKVVKLKVVDSASRSIIPYYTINHLTEAKTVKRVLIGDADGQSSIKIDDDFAFIAISCLGYSNQLISKEEIRKHFDANGLLTIFLRKSGKELNEVIIVSEKTLLKREIDRISYNVQSDPEKGIISVGDVLMKMPLISAGAGNLLLNGSSSYKIFLNGKPTALFSNNALNAMKSMGAENILRVEIITTPPSKYDSEGLAGIINIVTVRSGPQGYNGRLSTKYTSPDGPAANGSLNVRAGKVGLSSYFGYSELKEPITTSALFRTSPSSSLRQDAISSAKTRFPNGHIEAGYEIDSLNLLTASFAYSGNSGRRDMQQVTESRQVIAPTLQSYLLGLVSQYNSSSFDFGANYELTLNKKSNELLTFSYKNLQAIEGLESRSTITNVQPQSDNAVIALNNRSKSVENTLQIDYTKTFKDLTVEAGVKAILRRNQSNYIQAASDFRYAQDVYSAYNTYTLKHKAVLYKLGVRVERTDIALKGANSFGRSYYNLSPTLSILNEIDEHNSLGLGYTIRIERPGILELNPFTDRSDPRSISTGNPFLAPTSSHNLELNYSYTNSFFFNAGLNLFNVRNGIDIVTFYDPSTDVYTSTYLNANNSTRIGLNASLTKALSSTVNLTFNSDISYNEINGIVDGERYITKAYLLNLYSSLSKKIKPTLSITASGSFNNGTLLLQRRTNNAVFYSASVTKTAFKGKISISVAANNPFQKYRLFVAKTVASGTSQNLEQQNIYRKISVSVSYKFGQLKKSMRKNERTIINDDLKF